MLKTKPDPKLCYHKTKGLYFLRLSGRTFYLGPERAIAERQRLQMLLDFKASGGIFAERPPQDSITVAEVFDRWSSYAKEYYRDNPGHFDSTKAIFKPFLAVFSSMPAATFGPRALKAYRAGLCDGTLARKTVNVKIKAIRRVFTWAASEELIPVAVPQALGCIEGLRAGRTLGVNEMAPVGAVSWADVEATLPYMPSPVAGLMRLLWYTGARIGEVIALRAADIDTSGPVWTYSPAHHKTSYKGRSRTLYFGPEAQSILRPAMLAAPFGRALFSPLDSVAEKPAPLGVHRRKNQMPNAKLTDRVVREHYDPVGVCKAVRRAIVKANQAPERKDLPEVPKWHPHQIRHSFASRVRTGISLEAASVALGHADIEVTKLYATLDSALAVKVAVLMG